MGLFLAYIIKVAVCLLFFFAFNKLMLSRDTFHMFNRVMWLLIVVVSLTMPLFEWGLFNIEPIANEVYQIPSSFLDTLDPSLYTLVEPTNDKNIYSIVKFAMIIYIVFAIAFGVKLIVSYISLFALIISTRNNLENQEYLELLEKCKIILGLKKKINFIVHTKETAPFSWMNYIVVSKQDLEENGKEIIIHELSHIKQKHSWDLIIADLLTVFQWFNPASWLYKRSLQQVHEYAADYSVLQTGVNAKQYQLLLIKKAVGQRLYTMANSFNHSNLKNRITMMLKEKSNKWAAAKCLYALPLALFAVTAFANPSISNRFDEISSVKITQNSEIIDVSEEKNDVQIAESPTFTSKTTSTTKIHGVTTNKDSSKVVVYNYYNDKINDSIRTYIRDSIKGRNITISISNEQIAFIQNNLTDSIGVVIYNSKKDIWAAYNEALAAYNALQDNLTDTNLSAAYNEAMIAYNSIKSGTTVKIATTQVQAQALKQAQVKALVQSQALVETRLAIFNAQMETNKKMQAYYKQNPNNIFIGLDSIDFHIPTEKLNPLTIDTTNSRYTIKTTSVMKSDKLPLYIINGIEYTGDIGEINGADIANMDVIKNGGDTEKYGEKAKNGVVYITLKKNSLGISNSATANKSVQMKKGDSEMRGKFSIDLSKRKPITDSIVRFQSFLSDKETVLRINKKIYTGDINELELKKEDIKSISYKSKKTGRNSVNITLHDEE